MRYAWVHAPFEKKYLISPSLTARGSVFGLKKLATKICSPAVQSRQGVPSFASGHGRVPVRFRITGCCIRVRHFKSPQEKKEKDVFVCGDNPEVRGSTSGVVTGNHTTNCCNLRDSQNCLKIDMFDDETRESSSDLRVSMLSCLTFLLDKAAKQPRMLLCCLHCSNLCFP